MQDSWLNFTALTIIRIVVGTYFIAIALGLVTGVDPAALFAPAIGPETADLAGTVTLCALSLAFMAGVGLRLSSACLALFVIGSSAAQNLLSPAFADIQMFWRDAVLACAVVPGAVALQPRAPGKSSWDRLRQGETVQPRRIATGKPSKRLAAEEAAAKRAELRRAAQAAQAAEAAQSAPTDTAQSDLPPRPKAVLTPV
ncbi:MAG: hypothetical protein ACX93P_15100 [Roseovarius sp.]|nr:hypothetical protein [Roseovarius sp.]